MLKNYKDFIKESNTFKGDFIVDSSMIIDGHFKEGIIPEIIEGNFDCRRLYLTTLEGGPKEVGGNFNCSYNQLTSLKGGPEKVGGYFDCSVNNLTSLDGIYKNVYYLLSVSNNNNLDIEADFIISGSYINNYWEDLLQYMIKKKMNLEDVKGWPDGFLNDNLKSSIKGIDKFNL